LRLLAPSYTNPQIGDALDISRKTASHHVSSVLTKLDMTTGSRLRASPTDWASPPDTTAQG
jgi:DNA-binding NarL/FixJ family response regulator